MLDKRLWTETRKHRLLMALTIGLAFLGGVFTVAQAYWMSQVISDVFLQQATLAAVQRPMALLLGVMVLRAVALFGTELSANYLAIVIKSNLRQRLLAHILALGPGYTQSESSGELSNTLMEGVEHLEKYFSEYLPQIFISALIPLTILFSVFSLDLLSGLVLLFTAPLIPYFMVLIGRATEALTQRQWTSLSRLSAHFLDVVQGLVTLKALGRSKQQATTVRIISDQYAQATLGVLRVAFLSALVLELLATISTAIIAVQVGLRLLYGGLDFAPALFLLILAPEFYQPLRNLGARFHAGAEGVAAANRIFEVFETPLPEKSLIAPKGTLSDFASIQFKHVSLSYQERSQLALSDISFEINKGQKVALVGASGAGKSSIANLLMRFVDPQEGQIVVDGSDLQKIDRAIWRNQIAWVPQFPHLFFDSLAANIAFGHPDATQEQIEAAARDAELDDFIQSLPDGYATQVGERGLRLSGGQSQRVALARAFLRNPNFLILDEPTAHLDPQTETQLQKAIRRLMKERTTLIIVHRLDTVVDADQILVFSDGRIVQGGTHTELLEQEGIYRQLQQSFVGSP
ncbi:MAG: thiol reductant ABC exporter subunit CydD [Chloroflexi bacterium]|nr:MAG: thiol reductant ABC exporter subunit CydD [Chloroflexota bacterium]MBL1196453.1 thiol reductant ABC exporter subunit CydD [Chloroflexota bacterium]NOH13748.1 thiol reductant ABC exporter subunit CydD [Chloroflexota bacterium]